MAARVETGEAPRAAGVGARRGEGLREGGGVRRRAALAKGREEGSRSTAKADAAIDPTVEKKHATWPNHSSIFRPGFVLKRRRETFCVFIYASKNLNSWFNIFSRKIQQISTECSST